MSRYSYDNSGRFWAGLPARDLDDADLDAQQRQALQAAVTAGAYAPVAAPSKERKHGSKQQAEAAGDQGSPQPGD